MRDRKSRKPRKVQRRMLEELEQPLGYFQVIDHNLVVSVIRYYSTKEREEIEFMSQMALTDCLIKHTDKPGKCLRLKTTTKEEWEKWH